MTAWNSEGCQTQARSRDARTRRSARRYASAWSSDREETSLTVFPFFRPGEAASRTAGPHHFLRRIERSAPPSTPVAAEENRDPHRRCAVAGKPAILDPTSPARRAFPCHSRQTGA